MARPLKRTVDYFPHDADASEGKTITILENNFGTAGYAAWFKLLERLSKAENHVLTCRNTEDTEFLAAKLRLKPDDTRAFLSKCAELNAIDKELYDQGFIWSQNLVNRVKDVYDNRRQQLPQKPQVDIITGKLLPQTELLGIETQLSSVVMQQSKVKETKENNNIQDNHPKNINDVYQEV